MEWLDEVLSEGVLPEGELPAESAPAEDVDEVNRLLRRRRALQLKRDKLVTIHEKEVAGIDEWFKDAARPLDSSIEFIDRALEGWARAEFADTKVRTHNLPAGTLRLRAPVVSVYADDDDEAGHALVEAHLDDMVRTKSTPDRKAIGSVAERGKRVGADPFGVPLYEAVVNEPDSSTGELRKRVLPGVLLRLADEPSFSVQTKPGRNG